MSESGIFPQCVNTYLFHALEVFVTEVVDVCWLVSQDFSGEVVEQVWEGLWDRVLLQIFASHF